MVAKSFPRKQICKENNSWKIFLYENFLWLQYHFLENRLARKKFLKNFFGRKFFMVAKSFPRKQIRKEKNSWKMFLVENFLWLQNHFLENRFARKRILEKLFWSKICYSCKIISSKTDLQGKKFLNNFFCRKFFMFAKSFPRKQICKEKNSWKIFLVENLWLANHFLENRFERKKILETFFGRKFFMVAKSFPRKQIFKGKILENCFGRKCFMVAKLFPRKQICKEKNSWKIFFVETFLWLQNHFFENWFAR